MAGAVVLLPYVLSILRALSQCALVQRLKEGEDIYSKTFQSEPAMGAKHVHALAASGVFARVKEGPIVKTKNMHAPAGLECPPLSCP